MGRTTHPGISYFPLDTEFDSKHKMFIMEHGAAGLGFLITLLQMIYKENGYYIEDNKDLHLLLKCELNVDINQINVYINTLLSRQIFDKCLHKKHKILTSKGIQKRYLMAAKRKKVVEIYAEYLLIDINAYINPKNVYINRLNVNKNHIKEKEKEKEKYIPSNLDHQSDGLRKKNKALDICNWFLDKKIKQMEEDGVTLTKDIKNPKLDKWIDVIEKLNRIDGYEYSLIEKVLEFSINDEFWSKQIIGLGSLRKKSKNDSIKFDNLLRAYESSGKRKESDKSVIDLKNITRRQF